MKIIFLIITFFSVMLNAQSYLISNIPLPKTYIQNLDPYPCDEDCLQELLDNEMILSFLAHAQTKLDDPTQDEVRMMSISILNLGSQVSDRLKIALLLPHKKIGRYAATTTNASFAYLLARNQSFDLKTYNIDTETEEDIQKALTQIQNDGFGYIIAPFTKEGAETLISLRPYENVYFPTINKKDTNSSLQNVYFGGIDYKAQSDMLLKEAVSPLVVFYDRSSTGKKLAEYQEKKYMYKNIQTTQNNENEIEYTEEEILRDNEIVDTGITTELVPYDDNRSIVKFLIPRRTTNLEDQLFENESIKEGSFVVNTPIVKSSMIISQLTMYDTNATNVLSTQINYDPLILSLTQFEDRENMIIANSITQNNSIFIETNALLGNDIVYDWINYTTTVGVDYFFNLITSQDRQYKIEVVDNQMQYPIELLQPSKTRFIKYFSKLE
jgi:SRSO17 transposase